MYGGIARGKGTDEIVVRTWVPSWTLVLGGDLVGARRVFCFLRCLGVMVTRIPV